MKKVGRNEPCPCGGGKKYKVCCGSSSINMVQDEVGRLKLNRAIAYMGQIGIQRKNFCNSYMLKKQEIFKELSRKQNEMTSSKSETITCGKGCYHCCMLIVGASIQEVELIVYYLYQNEELFNYFIKVYPLWISKIREVRSLLKEPLKLDIQPLSDKSNKEKFEYNGFNNRLIFARQKLYCPFLREGTCSIYEVRPFYCAGYIATTPGEWCNPLHPNYFKRNGYQIFNVSLASDLSFYSGNLEKPVWSFMPVMVYDTLKYGTETLYKMQIFKALRQ